MAYIAAVQAYGSDSSTEENSGGPTAQDPVAPALIPLDGAGLGVTRRWLSGLQVSPRGFTPEIKIGDKDGVSDTITITDSTGEHALEFTAGILTGYTFTAV